MSAFASRIMHTLEEPAPQRPMWQRVLYPFLGLIALVVGIIGWLLPVIPGAPLAIIGIPWLFCFNQRSEQWARDRMRRALVWCRERWARLRHRHH
ncbi:MAG: hypothetical protein H0W72_04685 [Planctomycetes bacterium]|nr:hypothetical protein [Planctomycetota bacterium]